MIPFPLTDKVIIVTGGSRGIGLAFAELAASCGARLVISGRNADALQEAKASIESKGAEVEIVQADAGDSESASKIIQSALDRFERIDVLVNNAGITRDGLSMRMKDEDWESVLNVNLTGAFYMARAAMKPMMKARAGRIINITSVIGLTGNAGQANYAASKAGMIGMTKSLAKELASRNITVNAVAPGFIETRMTGGMKDEAKDAVLKSIPMGRYGAPEDVANLIAFLSADESGYITGQTFTVDGGLAI